MGQIRLALTSAGTRLLSASLAASIGCAGAVSQQAGGMRLKRSEPITSCGTGRASGPGAVDTVDIGWLQTPLMVLSYADPVYPEEAFRAGQEGRVEVQVLITPEGTVGKVLDVKGPQVFIEPAMAAVRGAEFTPPRQLFGQPAVVCATVIVTFQTAQGGMGWLQLDHR